MDRWGRAVTAKLFFFKTGEADGDASMLEILGSKGANLAELARMGIPVPSGFTVPTYFAREFHSAGDTLSDEFREMVLGGMARLEKAAGKTFGDAANPLLVSVRSGAPVSMPGMMETVLNLGMNDAVALRIAEQSDERFAYDTYRRFLEMYLQAVCGLPLLVVEQPMNTIRHERGFSDDASFDGPALQRVVLLLKELGREKLGLEVPQCPFDQLWQTIAAVFKSWNSARAKKYRAIHKISDDLGTAINVCEMVYGNRNERSGAGVCFTRDPSTGARGNVGEYLMCAQGEDVVAGIRTPKPLSDMKHEMPAVLAELEHLCGVLERHYRDIQDIEFTVDDGKLWLLQVRHGKRSAQAAFQIAVDLVEEGVLTKEEAIFRVEPQDFERLLLPGLDARAHKQVVGRGLPASPGAASGKIVFSASDAEQLALRGEDVILVREETSPDDIAGIHASRGLLTTRGGMTSHGAIVARQMGKCCVVGCGTLQIIHGKRMLKAGSFEVLEHEWITIDGGTGDVLLGKVATRESAISPGVATFLGWASGFHKAKVRANADTAAEALAARKMGANGIGLCRTERVFFESESLPNVWSALIATDARERVQAFARLRALQRREFVEILEVMQGCEVAIRLFDHPLIEFLPRKEQELAAAQEHLAVPGDVLRFRMRNLMQSNPALGHRGCRLGVAYPEIYEMQIHALVEATMDLVSRGVDVRPQIMLPFVSTLGELVWARKRFGTHLNRLIAAEEEFHGGKVKCPWIPFGVMIETPRAALIADKLAMHADFFCIGSGDLTQLTFGLSRDDSAPYMRVYKQEGILDNDPMTSFDHDGVGFLMRHACELGLKAKPNIQIGVCLEESPEGAPWLYNGEAGIDYVSCSSFRVPIAMLIAARAALQ
jgi:pyruvate,orthophosphate dikinase